VQIYKNFASTNADAGLMFQVAVLKPASTVLHCATLSFKSKAQESNLHLTFTLKLSRT